MPASPLRVDANLTRATVARLRGDGFREAHPEWCRKAEPLSVYEAKMADEMNPRLVEAGQAPLITEELIAACMCTSLPRAAEPNAAHCAECRCEYRCDQFS